MSLSFLVVWCFKMLYWAHYGIKLPNKWYRGRIWLMWKKLTREGRFVVNTYVKVVSHIEKIKRKGYMYYIKANKY
jgi:hypothetical protein